MGADFPADVFTRTPIATIRLVLSEITKQEQERINAESVAIARLTTILINIAYGFSGSKRPAPKVEMREFLPFPEASNDAGTVQGPDEHTQLVIIHLGKNRQIPPHITTALMTPVRSGQ